MGRSKKRKAKAKGRESNQERDVDVNNIAQILQSLSTLEDHHQPEQPAAGAPSLDLNLTLRPPQPQSSPHQQHATSTTHITPSSTSAFKKWEKPTSAAAAASSSTDHSSASSFQHSPHDQPPPPPLNPNLHPIFNISISLYNDLVQMLLGPPPGKQQKMSSSAYKIHPEAKLEAQENDQGNSKILPQPPSSTSALDSAHTVHQDHQLEKQNSESSDSGTERASISVPTAVGRFDHLPPPSLSYNDASEIVNTFVEAIGKVEDASDMTLSFLILEAGLKLPRCVGLLELYQSSGSMEEVVNYVMDYFKSWEAKEESQVEVKVSSEHLPEKDLQSES